MVSCMLWHGTQDSEILMLMHSHLENVSDPCRSNIFPKGCAAINFSKCLLKLTWNISIPYLRKEPNTCFTSSHWLIVQVLEKYASSIKRTWVFHSGSKIGNGISAAVLVCIFLFDHWCSTYGMGGNIYPAKTACMCPDPIAKFQASHTEMDKLWMRSGQKPFFAY